ncbi:unnamed protein product, partial [Ectocarpus sp. 4 AP-2014]
MELRAVISYKNRRGQTATWWANRLGHHDCALLMTREVKAETTLRLMSSQIARGDVKAVRSLVELGEPYMDNHREHLEAEIGWVATELEAASKKLLELSTLKEKLSPALEQLKASLTKDLARRRKIQREAAKSTRAGTRGRNLENQLAVSTTRPSGVAAISSRSFQAMQSRALRLFQRSVSRFQALTEDDFKRVADLNLLLEDVGVRKVAVVKAEEGENEGEALKKADSKAEVDGEAVPTVQEGDRDERAGIAEEKEAGRNPTPSLSAATSSSSSRRKLPLGQSQSVNDAEAGELGVKEVNLALSPPSATVPAAAAVLRVVRATVLVLGGCGLGALPSDKELWEAVKPMLFDGSLRHRVRHFDRRSIPVGVLDGVRALLNIVIDGSSEGNAKGNSERRGSGGRLPGPLDDARSPQHSDRTVTLSADSTCEQSGGGNTTESASAIEENHSGDEETTTAVDGNRAAHELSAQLSAYHGGTDNSNGRADANHRRNTKSVTLCDTTNSQIYSSTTDDGGGRTTNDHDDDGGEDGDDSDCSGADEDPWGDGCGESRWGQLTARGTGIGASHTGGGVGVELALIQALGSWCASVSAYDRLAHLPPGSAARRAAEAETEWDELERRIARSRLDVQLEEFSLQVLTEEIASATTSAEYLTQKRQWVEDRLGVARLLSLFSPAGHSLVSWAAACGQAEIVKTLMSHGATAELGDETRAVSASIIQSFYRFRRYLRQTSSTAAAAAPNPATTEHNLRNSCSSGNSSDDDGGHAEAATSGTRKGAEAVPHGEGQHPSLTSRRTEYVIEMMGRQATLARLRKSRRLPLTEAAYNGHHEVLQFFRLRRTPLYGASRTWLYPRAPPPFAPLGDGTSENYKLEAPMSVAECAEAGTRDRGCKERIPGRGWVGETDMENRFAVTERVAGAVWREITTVGAMGREEKGRRRALRIKMRKQEDLIKAMDAAIEDGYLKAPEVIALCQEGASIDRETENGCTALISAAEEDPHAPNHTWVRNEEGWEVLAAALLLDRRIHRPKIDYESKVTGHTALTRACALGRLETAEVLLDRGADINRRPKRRPITPLPPLRQTPGQHKPGSPPSLAAIPSSSVSRAAAAAVELRERFCRPPLVAAAAAGHASMVRLLLDRGADPAVADGNGETAADVAKRRAFVDVQAELARKEAGYFGVAAGQRGAANPLVPCCWGCGKLVETGHRKIEHEQECAHREVACNYKCGAYRLQHRELARHLAESCRLRPVVCSTRCGVSVVAEDYANHQA